VQPTGPHADWENGARRAWVVEEIAPQTALRNLPECLGSIAPAELASRRFAKVRYWQARHMLTITAELPDALHVRVDDQVELWTEDCMKGHIPRVSRVLAISGN
jgi:hypothetical protein